MEKVNHGGVVKDVCLANLPEIEVGDDTIVHIGFASSTHLTDQMEMIAVSIGEQFSRIC